VTVVYDLDSRLELFLDDAFIAEMKGATFQLHHPQPREVVFVFDAPWEGNVSAFGSFIQDGAFFRMYYRGAQWDYDRGEGVYEYTCYAQSRDGVHWERPMLRLMEFNGSKENNIIRGYAGCMEPKTDQWIEGLGAHNFMAFKDENPAAPTAQRYKAVAGVRYYGFFGFVSADGIHWERAQKKAFFPDTRVSDWVQTAFWDPTRQQYYAYLRGWDGPLGTGTRTICYCTSDDFHHWSELQPIVYDAPPTRQVQLYTNGILPYFRAPHLLIGMPMRFTPDRHKITEHPYDGLSDGGLLVSRDGHQFKFWWEAFIRPGLDQQNWIQRNNIPATGVLATAPGELSIYWLEHYYQDDCRLRRGTLRTDGFVSVNAPYAGGEFTTHPLTFAGRELVLNYSTSAMGSVQVEIRDAAGKPLPGFSLDQCPAIYGDELEHVVAWEAGTDVSSLAGRPVRLRFILRDADLFSLQFRG